jgi:hypothetical protein
MRKPALDYRTLRLRNLGEPQFRHLKLLLGWVVYFFLYWLTENGIPEESCRVIHCALDDRIPFLEGFVIFYAGWYLLILVSLGYFLFYSVERFVQLQTYFILVQLLATAVFLLFPSRQELRPEVFPRENVFTAVMGLLYRLDTPTGVCPSLHLAMSLGIASVWLREKSVSRWLRGGIAVSCLGVCLSVACVKQHAVVDILAVIPVSILAELVVFRWKK